MVADRNAAPGAAITQHLKNTQNLEYNQKQLESLKLAYNAATVEAEKFAAVPNLDPIKAREITTHVDATRIAYQHQSDIVKELQKDESKRIALLEKARDLLREHQAFYKIGTGPLATIVTEQQIQDINKPRRALPSLRSLMKGSLKDTWFNSGSIFTSTDMIGKAAPGSQSVLASADATTAAGIGGMEGKLAGLITSKGAAGLMASGGSMLAMAGLLGNRRGTGAGILEGTAGGALAGAGIGTMIMPGLGTIIGAAAGAVAGFGIGLGEKLAGVESPQHEAIRLVKELYGVKINSSMGDQIVALANSKYGKQVDIAVRDPDTRKMIELYSASTGQKMPLSASTPRGGGLSQQGGTLYQDPSYLYGQAGTYQSNLPVAGGGNPQTIPGPGGVTFKLDGPATTALLSGQVVETANPSFVQSQFSRAQNSSNGRLQNSAMLNEPGLVIG
jgi:hypothetical protein